MLILTATSPRLMHTKLNHTMTFVISKTHQKRHPKEMVHDFFSSLFGDSSFNDVKSANLCNICLNVSSASFFVCRMFLNCFFISKLLHFFSSSHQKSFFKYLHCSYFLKFPTSTLELIATSILMQLTENLHLCQNLNENFPHM